MKTILFVSTLFFLLGLKISKLIDFSEKVNVIDKIVTNQIMKVKSLDALPLFKDSEEPKAVNDEKNNVKNDETEVQAE